MAWQNYGWAWAVVGVRGSHYVMLHALADATDEYGVNSRGLCLQTLANRCNVTYECARRITRDLQEWGFLDIEAHSTPQRQQVSNRYRLHMDRLFPKASDIDQAGDIIGEQIWCGLLKELERMRGEAEAYLLRNQLREAFFDASNRKTSTEQWHGVLWLVAESDIVEKPFEDALKYLLKLRDFVAPYVIDYFDIIKRPRLKAPKEEQVIVEAAQAKLTEGAPC